jgi:hypothetical protein
VKHFLSSLELGLIVALFILGGCNVSSSLEQFKGFYLNKAQLRLDPNPQARRPSQLETGDHWLVWLSAFQKRGGWLVTGRGRQTTVFIEFAAQPELDRPIDLATTPLQATYEYGGEAPLYISREVTGTLTLHPQEDGTFTANLDATFSNPILGEGVRQVKGEILLQKHPHPDFSQATPDR